MKHVFPSLSRVEQTLSYKRTPKNMQVAAEPEKHETVGDRDDRRRVTFQRLGLRGVQEGRASNSNPKASEPKALAMSLNRTPYEPLTNPSAPFMKPL